MDNSTWRTSDLYLAAFCLCKDMQIRGTDRHGRRVVFVFDDSPDRENLIKGYLNNDVTIFPRQYKESIQALKDVIFQGVSIDKTWIWD